MSVMDAKGRPLHAGDQVRVGETDGTYQRFDDYGEGAVSGVLTGQAIVDVGPVEVPLPTFGADGGHVCYDVEKAR